MYGRDFDCVVCIRVEAINGCAISDSLDDIDGLLGFAISDDDIKEGRSGQLQADERGWTVSTRGNCALWHGGLSGGRWSGGVQLE